MPAPIQIAVNLNKTTLKMDKEIILQKYTEVLLSGQPKPTNVYAFCKILGIEETEFYRHFASFEHIEQYIFESMAINAVKLLEADEQYGSYDAKTKLLSFYFTLFESFTANRSLVLLLLKPSHHHLQNHKKLSGLRQVFFKYLTTLGFEEIAVLPNTPFEKLPQKSREGVAWIQWMATLRFWMEDTSPSFEKTDIFIEKAVNASFDLLEMKPVQHLMDFAKFLWQEHKAQ